MVPYRASAIELRSRRYNLAATRMQNINLRIGALNEVILEVYGLSVDLPVIVRGNMYLEPGDPPSMRRLPNSESGFERAYNRMMHIAKRDEHKKTRSNNKYSTLFEHSDYRDRGINMKHFGALRIGGLEEDLGFTRKARVKLTKPRDLERRMDLRYTEEDELKDLQPYKNDRDMALAFSIISKDTPSDRTIFSDRDCRITMVEVTNVTSTGGASASNLNIADAPVGSTTAWQQKKMK
ncbi:hypothetical protein T492DRAFT_834952 [Pavlovales sp. CCMP2436]|nr:hypothetical protein T492DRAFT_834952 [Pavlovales sp. CCMP2436]